jgi:general secretion pathway protein G
VLAVMATLMAVVAPVLFTHVGDARITAARSQMEVFALALDSYYADATAYPTTAQGLQALRQRPEATPVPRRWRGPYLRRSAPVDPWGREYQYSSPGEHDLGAYDLWTFGRDGVPTIRSILSRGMATSSRPIPPSSPTFWRMNRSIHVSSPVLEDS